MAKKRKMTAKIVPYNDEIGNAIRNVLFIFNFASPVPAEAVFELQKGGVHERLKAMLPKTSFQKQQSMVVSEGGNSFTTQQNVVGCNYEKFSERGNISLGLSVQPNQISVVCGEYTRWEAIRTSVEAVLKACSEWLCKYDVKVGSFALQYLDEFKVTFGPRDERKLLDLLSVDSPYLVRNFADLDQEFHSHHGYFKNPDFEIEGRLLNNVNVGANLSGDGESTIVQIQMIHRYDAKAVLELVNIEGKLSPLLVGGFEYLHQENKQVIGSLLTEPVKEMIKLNSRRIA